MNCLTGKKIIVQNRYKVDKPVSSVVRYVVFNSKMIYYIIFRLNEGHKHLYENFKKI